MSETGNNKSSSLSLQITKIASGFVGGVVLYNLWKKWNNSTPNVLIQSLHIYPVKSCKGFEVDSWPISKYGLQHDREWMVYNPKTKRFVTQRELNCLALITAELVMDDNNNVNGIKLSAPKTETIVVGIEKDESDKNRVENVTLWRDKVSGIDQGNDICEWLTKYINDGKEWRLLRMRSNDYKRKTNPKYTPYHLREQSHASYVDGYPYLIVSQSSLNAVNNALNKRGFDNISMNRFRPSIVIKTDLNEPFIEDRISRLKLIPKSFKFNKLNNKSEIIDIDKLNDESITFYLSHPCDRCNLPTIDQESAIPHKNEPTATLKTFRTGKQLGFDQSKHKKLFFGINAVHDKFNGKVIISKNDLLIPFFN